MSAVTGESLLALGKSAAVSEFEGVIATQNAAISEPPPFAEIHRDDWLPKRVVAIDASTLTHKVKNGFPGAEASLLLLSVVFIDISKLAAIKPNEIPSPRIFQEMDSAHTLDAVLPGANIVRGGVEDDTPQAYFRKTAYDAFLGHLDLSHESLLETFRAISGDEAADIRCPILGCDRDYTAGHGEYRCACPKQQVLFETDSLRFHQRFNETGPNGEVHGEVKSVLEVLSLVNILRFFEAKDQLHFLKDAAFVLEGPLAVFGDPARLAPAIRREIIRISELARKKHGHDILIMGVEKSGQYVSHFRELDWSDTEGPRGKFPKKSVLIPNAQYINEYIVRRPKDAKPSGADTYFGRKVFYKNANGAHVTLNMGMVNSLSENFHNVSEAAFPRLGHALNILDHLATYLHEDGFMPLIRAHAHVAIPLKQGGEILASLFGERP